MTEDHRMFVAKSSIHANLLVALYSEFNTRPYVFSVHAIKKWASL